MTGLCQCLAGLRSAVALRDLTLQSHAVALLVHAGPCQTLPFSAFAVLYPNYAKALPRLTLPLRNETLPCHRVAIHN